MEAAGTGNHFKDFFKAGNDRNMGQICMYSERCEETVSDFLDHAVTREPVFVCIGSDRITGDCLGPLVGQLLLTKYSVPYFVYGTLDFPIHAKNLAATTEFLQSVHPDACVIAIDASLGSYEDIGMIKFGRGGLRAGGAIRKDGPCVGDCYLTGVVNAGGFADHTRLFSTRLYLVHQMAEKIAAGIAMLADRKDFRAPLRKTC